MQLDSFKLEPFPLAPKLRPAPDHMNAAEMGFSLCIYSVYAAVHNNRQTMALRSDAVMTGSAAEGGRGGRDLFRLHTSSFDTSAVRPPPG